jgi:hypothetical protein
MQPKSGHFPTAANLEQIQAIGTATFHEHIHFAGFFPKSFTVTRFNGQILNRSGLDSAVE